MQLGAVVVSSVEELRAYADEHLGWAKTARTDRERNIFLQMAKTWLEAAAMVRSMGGLCSSR
jgi:hypothetical protein